MGTVIEEELRARGVPASFAPLGTFLSEAYGREIPAPETLTFEEAPQTGADRRYCAGKAPMHRLTLHATLGGREISFPFRAVIPAAGGRHPFFVMNDFNRNFPGNLPVEEIVDHGFGLIVACYLDVTSDDGNFSCGMAGALYENGERRAPDDPGKIAMWAWANRRMLDYALTRDDLDPAGAVVTGHSRLGKTALLTAALDPRFPFVAVNNSGCMGDALSRGNTGEQIGDIYRTFPFWFCPAFEKYGRGVEPPFDQHALVAAVAPRVVMIGCAAKDAWADPRSQYLSACAASPAWEKKGVAGFLAPDRLPEVGDDFREGNVTYHLRDGMHYYSREDFNVYMETVRSKLR